MPKHVKIICIHLNIAIAIIFLLMLLASLGDDRGLLVFLFFGAVAAVSAYSAYNFMKVQRFLNEEELLARELRMKKMREELHK